MFLIRVIINIILILAISFLIGCGPSTNKQVGQPSQTVTDNNQAPPQVQVKQEDKKSYPDWFWNPPCSDDTLYAIGYGTSALRLESSEKKAIEDGLASLVKFMSVHVNAKMQLIGVLNGIISDRDIQESVSPESEAFVKENHQIAAKFVSPVGTFVLLRLGEKSDSTPENSSGSDALPPEPSWVTTIPKEDGYIHAVGQSNIYLRETDSWRNAEKSARAALAMIVETKLDGVTLTYNQASVSVTNLDTNVQLNNIQIIKRWKNKEMNTCHVLARMLVSDELAPVSKDYKEIIER